MISFFIVITPPYSQLCVPLAPENGSIVAVPSTLGGAKILFRCNTGFVPTGNMTAVCTSDGVSPNETWTPNPATLMCIGK